MAKKVFTYRGMELEELQKLSINELAKILPSRQRRSILRGLDETKKKLISDLEKKDNIKTHVRDMVILPQWVGKTIRVYNGKEYVQVNVEGEMIGHMLGEFALTRALVRHSAPGVGATKSSTAISSRTT